MAYEVKELPYAYDKLNGISEETMKRHHDKHYAGYVKKRNETEEKLQTADKSKANANYSEFGVLKRAETFNASGQILHEMYFDNLGGDGNADESLAIIQHIIKDFGSVENYKEDLRATAAASLGWAITCYDFSSGKLKNFLCDFHNDGAVWGAMPLVALDVFEHAYYGDFGPARGEYLKVFFENLNWQKINEHYEKMVKPMLG